MVPIYSLSENGFRILTPAGSKSRTLRVTTVSPCARAVAAIDVDDDGGFNLWSRLDGLTPPGGQLHLAEGILAPGSEYV